MSDGIVFIKEKTEFREYEGMIDRRTGNLKLSYIADSPYGKQARTEIKGTCKKAEQIF